MNDFAVRYAYFSLSLSRSDMTRPRKRERDPKKNHITKTTAVSSTPDKSGFRTFSPQYHHKHNSKTAERREERENGSVQTTETREQTTERFFFECKILFIQWRWRSPKTATGFAENPPILAVGIFVNSNVKRGLVLIWRQLVPVLLLSQAERLSGLEWLAHGVYVRSCGSYSLMIRIPTDSDLIFWFKQTYSDSIWW